MCVSLGEGKVFECGRGCKSVRVCGRGCESVTGRFGRGCVCLGEVC